MNYIKFGLASGVTLAAMACSEPDTTSAGIDTRHSIGPSQLAAGDLNLADGTKSGTVELVSDGKHIKLLITVSGLPAGKHGFHLHETGQCDGPDFKSAGGHLNPLGKSHGKDSPDGSHVGDLPNLAISSPDSGPQEIALDGSKDQMLAWLFDDDGTAAVVHADQDDYKTDPSGAAGARIACAVLAPIANR